MSATKLSIVTTLYRSAPFINELARRCFAAAGDFDSIELILVDDGSPDDSLKVACDLAEADLRVRVIELSRNFGHHRAILAGLSKASGDWIFFLDSDLEEPPEVLPEFYRIVRDANCDVVYGIHGQTEGSRLRRITSRLFWRSFGSLGGTNTPANICNIRLMSRRYVEALCALPEREVFLGGLFHWIGFKQIAVLVERKLRRESSTYSFWARVRLASRAVIAFSNAPLRAMFWIGMFIAGAAALIAVFYFILKLTGTGLAAGYSSLIISIWFLSGIIIACLGVLGLYVSYIFDEVKARPRTIIRRVHGIGES
jgi:putative glycosyltransferase